MRLLSRAWGTNGAPLPGGWAALQQRPEDAPNSDPRFHLPSFCMVKGPSRRAESRCHMIL